MSVFQSGPQEWFHLRAGWRNILLISTHFAACQNACMCSHAHKHAHQCVCFTYSHLRSHSQNKAKTIFQFLFIISVAFRSTSNNQESLGSSVLRNPLILLCWWNPQNMSQHNPKKPKKPSMTLISSKVSTFCTDWGRGSETVIHETIRISLFEARQNICVMLGHVTPRCSWSWNLLLSSPNKSP